MTKRAALLVLFAACGGDTVLHTCDIREPSCQYDVFLAVQDVRGNVWDPWLEPPPMRVISEADYRAEVIAAQEQAVRDAPVDYFTPALKLLHMIDPDEPPSAAADFKVDTVSAYYEAATKRMTIVDHGKPMATRDADMTLAHELTHAAQDRDVGFGTLFQHVASADNTNAINMLVEGEAHMVSVLVDAKEIDLPKTGIDWTDLDEWTYDVRRAAFGKSLPTKPVSPYRIVTSQSVYPLGASYLAQAYTAGGPLAVRRIFDHPPLTAARFIAGLGALGDHAQPPWACSAPASPPGFEQRVGDELGALGVYSLATRLTTSELDAWERAQRWTGDRFFIYVDPNNASALTVVWLIRLESAASAAAFQAAFARSTWVAQSGAIQTLVDGAILHVIASNVPVDPSYEAWTLCLPL